MHGTDMITASAWVLDYTMDSRKKERVPFSGLPHAEKESSRNFEKAGYGKGKSKRGQPLLPLLSESLSLNTKAVHTSLSI